MMSNYQNEAEIRDHVFGKEPLRPQSSVLCQIACAALRDRDSRSPRHGLESPCHVARAFQPVGLGRAVRSALRQLLRPPISPFPPVKNPSVCSVGPPSAFCPLSSAVPSDSCALCASLRSTLGHPPTRRVQHPNIPEGETILPAPKQSPPPSLLRLLFTRVPARALEVSWPRIGSISTSAEKNDPLIGLLYPFRDSTSSWRKSAAVGSHSPRMAASPADSYLPPGRGRSVANGGSP